MAVLNNKYNLIVILEQITPMKYGCPRYGANQPRRTVLYGHLLPAGHLYLRDICAYSSSVFCRCVALQQAHPYQFPHLKCRISFVFLSSSLLPRFLPLTIFVILLLRATPKHCNFLVWLALNKYDLAFLFS